MTHLGEFSPHTRDGEYVTKQLTARHPAGSRFVAAVARTGETGMRSYLDILHSAGVTLPEELHIVAEVPLTVRHRWMTGPTLMEIAATDPAIFAAAVPRLVRWVRDLDGTDARIDTNLENFCLTGDRPVLVDVLPPLVSSLRPCPENLFDELFGALCFDTPVILDALVGYAFRALLRTSHQSARGLLPLAHDITDTPVGNGFPARWFRARLRLAAHAAEGEVPPDQLHDFFTLTSVLGFRQLDETGRRLHLDRVARHLREWGM